MCGIFSVISKERIDKENFEKATKLMRHRGSDDYGIMFYNSNNYNIAFGHQRLSIIDLSHAGHQPMCNENKTIWLIYNGEIYNFEELRHFLESKGHIFKSNTDTEVIIHSYEEWGEDCLEKFNGMFAFIIWDSAQKKIFAARDRLGIKPLYYYYTEDFLCLSSEIKSILTFGLADVQPDWEAFHNPMQHFILSPNTGFKNIYKLPPGFMLHYSDNGIQIDKYWDISPAEENINEKNARIELDDILHDAVRLQCIADVPVGVLLSGGLDSSLIVALMSKVVDIPLRTFTIKYTESDKKFESVVDDSFYAKKVAALFACEHQEINIQPDIINLLPKIIWHLDEPLADPAAINTYLIAKEARSKGVKVLLNGMGGDEIFGGYRKQLACLFAEQYQRFLPVLIRRGFENIIDIFPVAGQNSTYKSIRWARQFATFASKPRALRFLTSEFSSIPEKLYNKIFIDSTDYPYNRLPAMKQYAQYFKNNGLSYLTQMCLADTKIFLPDHNLTYSDKAMMAAGVEGRPPLTDHKIVEFMFNLAPRFRIRKKNQKYLLKEVAKDYLPKDIVFRPKAPFGAPLRAWIRYALKEVIDDYLNPGILKKRGLYNPEVVWQLIKDDRKGKDDNAHLIWTILTREIWFRTFIDNDGSQPIVL